METEKIDLKTYLKVVYGMGFVAFALGFIFFSWTGGLAFMGAFLLMEHLYSWTAFSMKDVFGHEWLGAFLLIIAIVLSDKWLALPFVLIAIVLNANFKHPFKNEIKILFKKK